ncbi:MAG TPA: hypothetical protein ENN29_04990 [Candidatus Hydrogenedentes bacterium]|nr:hypothetical protein [Candidatus Hydrogenedentota bacterium]
MDTFRTLVGWGLFLVMAIAAGFFWRQSAVRGKHINEMGDTIAAMAEQIQQLTASVADMESQMEQAEMLIGKLNKRDIEENAADTAEAGNDMLSGMSQLGLTFGDMLDMLLNDFETENEKAGVNFMAEMFQGPQGEQMLEMGVRMMLDMQFGEFFTQVAPESVDAVKEIIGDYMIHSARIGIGLVDAGDAAVASAFTDMESTRLTMLSELRGVIGDEGVAMYEQYERELPGRMINQSLEMQLGMFARGLSAETRDMVRRTLTEELIASQPADMMTMPTPRNLEAGMQMQDEAYERALERLTPHLTEEEYGVVERFVRQQQTMVNSFGSLMGIEKGGQ